jgi:hypothetical protein
MVENAPEVILNQRSMLMSSFNALGDFSFTDLQSSRVHLAEVDWSIGFYLHDERFLLISELRDFRHFMVVKILK